MYEAAGPAGRGGGAAAGGRRLLVLLFCSRHAMPAVIPWCSSGAVLVFWCSGVLVSPIASIADCLYCLLIAPDAPPGGSWAATDASACMYACMYVRMYVCMCVCVCVWFRWTTAAPA